MNRISDSEQKKNSRRYQHKVKKGSRKIVKIHRHRRKFITYILFGRFMIILLLLTIQFSTLFLLGRFLNPFLKYFVNGFDILSFIFIIFLVNSNSTPEFKLAWMIPVAVVPVFGVLFYLFFKSQFFKEW